MDEGGGSRGPNSSSSCVGGGGAEAAGAEPAGAVCALVEVSSWIRTSNTGLNTVVIYSPTFQYSLQASPRLTILLQASKEALRMGDSQNCLILLLCTMHDFNWDVIVALWLRYYHCCSLSLVAEMWLPCEVFSKYRLFLDPDQRKNYGSRTIEPMDFWYIFCSTFYRNYLYVVLDKSVTLIYEFSPGFGRKSSELCVTSPVWSDLACVRDEAAAVLLLMLNRLSSTESAVPRPPSPSSSFSSSSSSDEDDFSSEELTKMALNRSMDGLLSSSSSSSSFPASCCSCSCGTTVRTAQGCRTSLLTQQQNHTKHKRLGGQMAERLGNRAINQKVVGLIPGRTNNDLVSLGKALHPTCLEENVPVLTVSRSG